MHPHGPVGDDAAVIAQGLTQHCHGLAVIADVAVVHHLAVVQHDPAGAVVDNGALPADQPGIHQICRALCACIGGTATAGNKVLGAGVDTVFLISLGFDANHLGDVVHVIAVPGADFHAVGVEGDMEANGALLLGVLGNHVIQQLLVMSDAEGIVRHIDHACPGVVAAVTAEHHGNAQAGGLCDFLEGVVLVNQGIGRAVDVVQIGGDIVGDDGMVHGDVAVAILVGVGRLVGIQPVLGIGVHGGEGAAGGSVPQQADFFIQGHLAQQVIHTGIHILPPVLVYVQLAVAVEVFEFQAVYLDDGLGASLQAGLTGGLIGIHNHLVHFIGLCEGGGVDKLCAGRCVKILLCHCSNRSGQCHRQCENQGNFSSHGSISSHILPYFAGSLPAADVIIAPSGCPLCKDSA